MCRSACENFFISCGYEKALWRCGKSRWFNGYEPESPISQSDGNVTYLREYFPGQPFRENKFTTAGHERSVCTPAVDGSASSNAKVSMVTLLISILCIFGTCMSYFVTM
jgi:hypothetical protein